MGSIMLSNVAFWAYSLALKGKYCELSQNQKTMGVRSPSGDYFRFLISLRSQSNDVTFWYVWANSTN